MIGSFTLYLYVKTFPNLSAVFVIDPSFRSISNSLGKDLTSSILNIDDKMSYCLFPFASDKFNQRLGKKYNSL